MIAHVRRLLGRTTSRFESSVWPNSGFAGSSKTKPAIATEAEIKVDAFFIDQ